MCNKFLWGNIQYPEKRGGSLPMCTTEVAPTSVKQGNDSQSPVWPLDKLIKSVILNSINHIRTGVFFTL